MYIYNKYVYQRRKEVKLMRKRIVTISRMLKVDKELRRYLEDNMWYRRRIYNKFVEWYREWDTNVRDSGIHYDWNQASKNMYQYELENFDYTYYCTGIRERCAKNVFDIVNIVIKERLKGNSSELRFTCYDKYKGSFKVYNKIQTHGNKDNPTSAKCMILDETHVRFSFNKNNVQTLELKEPFNCEALDDPRIMFKSFTSQRYRFQNKDIKEVVFVKKLNKYYINFIVEVEILDYDKHDRNFLAGIDLGLRNPVTMCYLNDNGKEVIEKFNMSDKEYRRIKYLEIRINRLSQIMSRKMEINRKRVENEEIPSVYTRNYEKVRKKFRISHRKLFNVKRNWRLKLAHYIVNHYDNIVVDEFTNPVRCSRERKARELNRFRMELGMGYFMQTLRWMADRYNCNYIDSPSDTTRTCCRCGHVNEHLKLGKKYLKCVSCGTRIDRDVNAAYNCFKYGLKEIIA